MRPASPAQHHLPPAGSRKLLQDDAYVCIRPLQGLPGDWLDTTLVVHCYLQEGDSEAPAWSMAFDGDGTHAEVDTDHSKRECYPVTGASLTVRVNQRLW